MMPLSCRQKHPRLCAQVGLHDRISLHAVCFLEVQEIDMHVVKDRRRGGVLGKCKGTR